MDGYKLLNNITELESIIFLHTDLNGEIITAGRGAINKVGEEKCKGNIKEFFIDFNSNFVLNNYSNNNSHLLNIETINGLPETFNFKFIKHDNGYYIIGENNIDDISFLKKNLLEMNNELSNLSRELYKKNADLIKLNQEKNRFLGIVAHDLRNPIGAIQGYSEILLYLQKDNINYDITNILKIINETSENTLKLLEDLLDITKIESGNITLNKTKSDFKDLIQKTIIINNIIAQKKDISIKLNSEIQILEFDFDRLKMEQVLNNLISNAIKFSYPGNDILISLSVTGSEMFVQVKDNGQGVLEAEIGLLFRPLEKISVRSTAGEKSTGLGLSIAKSIVESHGGTIGVSTIHGKGSTFFFKLPLNQ
jgi:signal transduction histidine kinase